MINGGLGVLSFAESGEKSKCRGDARTKRNADRLVRVGGVCIESAECLARGRKSGTKLSQLGTRLVCDILYFVLGCGFLLCAKA